MKEFDNLCREFEQLDLLSYGAVLAEKSLRILPALREITEDGLSGAAIFSSFILGAIAADGRLSEEEYVLLYPLLNAFFGDSVNYDDCKKLVKAARSETRLLKKAVDEMVDVLGLLSDDLKNDIIIVCLMICAVDGKVSLKEKQWIRQLIR